MTLKKEFERLLTVLYQDGDISDLGLRMLEGFSLNLENSCALDEAQAVRQNEKTQVICDYCKRTEVCKGAYPEGCFLENKILKAN